MLGINVTYTMRSGMREDFLRLLEKHSFRSHVLAEQGCLGYDYYRSATDPDVLLLVERWTDRQAQQAHLQQPHMALAQQAKEAYVADTKVELYQL